jgi:hypothetical protein
MCDVPSESIECFPGTASKFFFKLLVTIPVAPIITGIIVHFRFYIRCVSLHKLLYFNFFIIIVVIIIIIIIIIITDNGVQQLVLFLISYVCMYVCT